MKMSFFYKMKYCEEKGRFTIYNWGCNFKCKVCTYRINSPYRGEKPIPKGKIKDVISDLQLRKNIRQVNFVGGEPTTNPYLKEIVDFVRAIGLSPILGHTNGSGYLRGFKSATVSMKAFSKDLHIHYTGVANEKVLENIRKYWREGVELKINTVFVPEYVDLEEIEKISSFISTLSSEIPFHIIGYIPVPGLSFRRPKKEEILLAVEVAKKHLRNVSFSLYFSVEEINYRSTQVIY